MTFKGSGGIRSMKVVCGPRYIVARVGELLSCGEDPPPPSTLTEVRPGQARLNRVQGATRRKYPEREMTTKIT